VVRARTIGTSMNVGALGVGPLVVGALAQWTGRPLSLLDAAAREDRVAMTSTLMIAMFVGLSIPVIGRLALSPGRVSARHAPPDSP
jgi:hypothetical protein